MKRLALLTCLCMTCGSAFAVTWDDLWSRPDQQAQRLLESGRAADAAQRFTDPRRRAFAEIQAGQFAQAARHLEPFEDVDSLYNRGNALARAGDLRGALTAYDAALSKDPDNRDVRHNRDLVARALEQQKHEKGTSSGRSGGQHGAGHSAGDGSSPGSGTRNAQQGSSANSAASGTAGSQSASSSGVRHSQSQSPDSGASNSEAENSGASRSGTAQAQGRSGAQSGAESARGEGTRGTGEANTAAAGAASAQTAPGSGANANGAAQSGSADARREAEIAADLMRKQADRGTPAAGSEDAGKRSAAASPYALGTAENGDRSAQHPPKPVSEETLALDQWLRRIPDDPGELLQRKFLIEHLMKQRSAEP